MIYFPAQIFASLYQELPSQIYKEKFSEGMSHIEKAYKLLTCLKNEPGFQVSYLGAFRKMGVIIFSLSLHNQCMLSFELKLLIIIFLFF